MRIAPSSFLSINGYFETIAAASFLSGKAIFLTKGTCGDGLRTNCGILRVLMIEVGILRRAAECSVKTVALRRAQVMARLANSAKL